MGEEITRKAPDTVFELASEGAMRLITDRRGILADDGTSYERKRLFVEVNDPVGGYDYVSEPSAQMMALMKEQHVQAGLRMPVSNTYFYEGAVGCRRDFEQQDGHVVSSVKPDQGTLFIHERTPVTFNYMEVDQAEGESRFVYMPFMGEIQMITTTDTEMEDSQAQRILNLSGLPAAVDVIEDEGRIVIETPEGDLVNRFRMDLNSENGQIDYSARSRAEWDFHEDIVVTQGAVRSRKIHQPMYDNLALANTEVRMEIDTESKALGYLKLVTSPDSSDDIFWMTSGKIVNDDSGDSQIELAGFDGNVVQEFVLGPEGSQYAVCFRNRNEYMVRYLGEGSWSATLARPRGRLNLQDADLLSILGEKGQRFLSDTREAFPEALLLGADYVRRYGDAGKHFQELGLLVQAFDEQQDVLDEFQLATQRQIVSQTNRLQIGIPGLPEMQLSVLGEEDALEVILEGRRVRLAANDSGQHYIVGDFMYDQILSASGGNADTRLLWNLHVYMDTSGGAMLVRKGVERLGTETTHYDEEREVVSLGMGNIDYYRDVVEQAL